LANDNHQWMIASSGSANGSITFTQAMTLDASGNLLVGSATNTEGARLKVNNGYIFLKESGGGDVYLRSAYGGTNPAIQVASASPLLFITNNTERTRITSSGNTILAYTGSDSGELLQVNGTAKITGALTADIYNSTRTSAYLLRDGSVTGYGIYKNSTTEIGIAVNGSLALNFASTGAATFSSSVTAASGIFTGNLTVDTNTLFVDATNNRVGIGTASPSAKLHIGESGAAAQLWLQRTDGYNPVKLIGGTLADGNGFKITMNTTDVFAITSSNFVGINNTSPSYALDVTGSARVSDAIAIGTTPDTNNPFKILKNINATVGIKFENTNTSSSAFSAVQLGTDVSGGTKFTNLVYASSGISASGVYNPDGTSLINNGNGGLNFLGNPIRMYTGGSNGVLRWDLVNDGYITHYSATSPTTSATDSYRQYSADVTAGNAAPHFRTENGAVIKLYQETTAVGNSTISVGGGNSVLDDTEFDGYTLRQIVKALRNQGILA
jgi:hypothetical protein